MQKKNDAPTDPTETPTGLAALTRIVGLIALLAIEVTLLTGWFDFGVLTTTEGRSGRLSHWLIRLPMAMRLASVAVGSMVAFSLTILWPELRRNYRQWCRVDHWPLYLIAHGAALTAFAYGTRMVLEGRVTHGGHALLGIAAWLAAGAASLGLWCLAALPWRLWRRVALLGWPMLAVAGVVAVIVWRSKAHLKGVWRPLAEGTFWLSRKFLSLAYSDVIYSPQTFTLGTPQFRVNIARDCSGYEGVGLIIAFLAAYLWLFRQRLRFPHALLLLPVGALSIWVANSARIALLIALGASWSRDVALGGFHSQAGWLAFNLVALGLVAVAGRSRCFARVQEPATHRGDPNPTAAYLLPFLAIVGTTMLTTALTAGFDWLYPVRVVAAGALLWLFRKSYADLRWTLSIEAMAVGAVTCVLWLLLAPAGDDTARRVPAALAKASPVTAGVWLAFRVLGYVVTVPLAEELAFRSYLTRRLVSTNFSNSPVGHFTWLSFLGSSLAFGALHGRQWLPAMLAGMLFAGLLYRRRETADAVVAHATANLLLAVYALVTGNWAAWS